MFSRLYQRISEQPMNRTCLLLIFFFLVAVSNEGWGNAVSLAKLHSQYGNQECNSLILAMSSLLCSQRNTLPPFDTQKTRFNCTLAYSPPPYRLLYFFGASLFSNNSDALCASGNPQRGAHLSLMVYDITASQISGCYRKHIFLQM